MWRTWRGVSAGAWSQSFRSELLLGRLLEPPEGMLGVPLPEPCGDQLSFLLWGSSSGTMLPPLPPPSATRLLLPLQSLRMPSGESDPTPALAGLNSDSRSGNVHPVTQHFPPPLHPTPPQ